MQNLGGGGGQIRCLMGNVQVAYKRFTSVIRHSRTDDNWITGAEMCPAVVSGFVIVDTPVSCWPIFPCPW